MSPWVLRDFRNALQINTCYKEKFLYRVGLGKSTPTPWLEREGALSEIFLFGIWHAKNDDFAPPKAGKMLIRAEDSVLVVVDMQDRLVPAMQAPARTIKNTAILCSGAIEMQVPIVMTEQYPQGLGKTVSELQIPNAVVLSKMHFSCMEDEGFAAYFESLNRKQAVIAGMEAHICVVQTAASMMEAGYDVFVVSDATASRTLESEAACIARLSALGAGIVTTEMVIFEWLGEAGTPAFKAMLKQIK